MDPGPDLLLAAGFFESWSNWFHPSPEKLVGDLWGLPILWWGRIGKLLQFTGGATLVLDLIGPQRLNAFGRRLHRTFELRRIFHWWLGALKACVNLLFEAFKKKPFPEVSDHWSYALIVSLAFATGAFFFLWNLIEYPLPKREGPFTWEAFRWHLLSFLRMVSYGGLSVAAAAAVATLTSLFALLFEFLVIEPAACVLGHQDLEWLVKLFAFLALLIGFQFDLLAS